MAYRPEPIGGTVDLPELVLYLLSQLESISDEIERLGIRTYNSVPKNPYEGMIVIADGVGWDPGSGAGFYGYRNGAWRALEV